MAETTTATSQPASTSRLTCRATFLMRSTVATEVPPNFITRRGIRVSMGSLGDFGDAMAHAALSPTGPRRYRCGLALSTRAPPVHQFSFWVFGMRRCGLARVGEIEALLSRAGAV